MLRAMTVATDGQQCGQ